MKKWWNRFLEFWLWILGSVADKFRAWQVKQHIEGGVDPLVALSLAKALELHREVSPDGRVYYICGGCGVTLGVSATLCESCVTKPVK